MKFTFLLSVPALSVMTLAISVPLAAQPQARYTLTDLGAVGDPFSQATALNNYGLVTGVNTAADGSLHAVAWFWGTMTDISKPGLGGANSSAGAVNKFGQIAGIAETSAVDPNNENFCGFGSGHQCVAFLWDFETMTALPGLGGTNSESGWINNLGEVAGIAETAVRDKNCPTQPAANGTGPYVLDFEPVVWGPSPGELRKLPLLPADTVGMAFGINDAGQVVGVSGTCANSYLPGFAAGPHAVLWDQDGTVHLLPNLGGSNPDPAVLAVGNVAFEINNNGVIAGQSALSDNTTFHPALWQDGIVADLGVLPGDKVGAALDLNNRGEVVGASIAAPGPPNGNARAWLWRDGVMTDLNTLVPENSPLYLLTAFAINDSGEIVGFGATPSGDIHGFLATPCGNSCGSAADAGSPWATRRPALSDNARKFLLRRGLRGH